MKRIFKSMSTATQTLGCTPPNSMMKTNGSLSWLEKICYNKPDMSNPEKPEQSHSPEEEKEDLFDGEEHSLESDLAVVGQVVPELEKRLAQSGWSEDDVYRMQLATREALVNAIKHGNRELEEKSVHVTAEIGSDQVRLMIRDEGEGFDWANLPKPVDPKNLLKTSGRGIDWMKRFFDKVEFEFVEKEQTKGIKVTLTNKKT